MAYNDNQGGFGARPQRQLFDVTDLNLKCADCGTPITQLPFRPSSGRDVFCFECNKKRNPRNFSNSR